MALFHGFLESTAIWRACPDRMWAGHHAIALPLPGHGPWCDRLDGDTFIDDYARLLECLRPGKRWRLVGHSTGAMVALALAHRAPHLVSDLCAVAPLFSGAVCGRNWQGAVARLPIVGQISFAWLIDRWLADRKAFLDGVRTVTATPKARLSKLADMRDDLRECSPAAMYKFGTWIGAQDLSGRLSEIEHPIHAMICAKDPVVDPHHQLALIAKAPRASAILLESGHLPMVERAGLFADAFASWRNHRSAAPVSPQRESAPRFPVPAPAAQPQFSHV